MAITYATLAQEIDGKVEYIYPKTVATLVEYDTEKSVKDKIDEIDKDIANIDNRISDIVEDTTDITNELTDIRNQNYNLDPNGVYDSAGDAVRGQFEAVLSLINANTIKIEKNTENISKNTNTITSNVSKELNYVKQCIDIDYTKIAFDTSEIVK